MAVLTVSSERIQTLDDIAIQESRSRDDLVNDAIDLYLRRREFLRISTDVREAFQQNGITEKDVEDAICEVRAERSRRK